jgi:hypothetical protein
VNVLFGNKVVFKNGGAVGKGTNEEVEICRKSFDDLGSRLIVGNELGWLVEDSVIGIL